MTLFLVVCFAYGWNNTISLEAHDWFPDYYCSSGMRTPCCPVQLFLYF